MNGAVQPYLPVATRKYRLRILNGSNARQYNLALSNGQPLVQIGTDGGLLPQPLTRSSILITPGERVEVIADLSSYKVGTKIGLKNTLGFGRTADVLRFDVVRKEGDTSSVPSTLRPLALIPPSQAMRTRTWTLGMSMDGKFTINGLPYDPARVDADPMLNTTEIWEFVNPMGMDHPMHAHDIMWQVLDRNGAPPPAWEVGWKDTWLVPAKGRLRVIGTFADYTCEGMDMDHTGMDHMMADLNTYMVHCHILEHEDHGMMAPFKVMPGEQANMG